MAGAYSDRLLVGKEQSNELDVALMNGAGVLSRAAEYHVSFMDMLLPQGWN